MQNQHLNRTDDEIRKGIAGLRQETAPNAPAQLASKMIEDRHPARRPTSWVWRAAAFGGCAALASVAALWPQGSAGAALRKVIMAQNQDIAAHANSARHELTYSVLPDGSRHLALEMYLKGGHTHLIQDDGVEEEASGDRAIVYDPKEGYAMSDRQDTTADVSITHVLNQVLTNSSNQHVVLEHNFQWRGRTVDKYRIEFALRDANGDPQRGFSTLLADPNSNLPLYEDTAMDHSPAYAHEWQYLDVKDDAVKIKMPPGTVVYDLPAERAEVKENFLQDQGSEVVAGRKVALHGVIFGQDGVLIALVSGSDGLPSDDSGYPLAREYGPEVEGLPRGQFGTFGNARHYNGAHHSYPPDQNHGTGFVWEGVRLPKGTTLPDQFTLRVPVWRWSGNGPHDLLKLAGFATFSVDHVIRTGSTNYMLCPGGLSIFEDPSQTMWINNPIRGGAATKAR